MKQKKLIAYYTAQLEKVKSAFGNSELHEEYIKNAERNLVAVKNGRNW